MTWRGVTLEGCDMEGCDMEGCGNFVSVKRDWHLSLNNVNNSCMSLISSQLV